MSASAPLVPLEPAYFGPAWRLALLWTGQGRVDPLLRHDKRHKSTHRCEIADVNGRLRLTVPVAASPGARTWSDVTVSGHGKWPSEHITALESAYGRTPWCEFFMPRLAPVIAAGPGMALPAFTAAVDAAMLSLLPPPPPGFRFAQPEGIVGAEPEPYWQVRSQALGFIGSLSAIDLLMNLGPDAAPALLALGC